MDKPTNHATTHPTTDAEKEITHSQVDTLNLPGSYGTRLNSPGTSNSEQYPPLSIVTDKKIVITVDNDNDDDDDEDGFPNRDDTVRHRQTKSNSAASASTPEHLSLLEQGEETMALAMLIFLLADLRQLSATGRIRTRFEHLALDSDRSPRLTSRDFAGFYDYEETEGVTASHIMGVLLLEILREVEDASAKKNSSTTNLLRRRRFPQPTLLSPWSDDLESTGVNARKIFRRDIRAANGMPSLLHCYNTMLSEDVNPTISPVSRHAFPLDQDLRVVGGSLDTVGFGDGFSLDDSFGQFNGESILRTTGSLATDQHWLPTEANQAREELHHEESPSKQLGFTMEPSTESLEAGKELASTPTSVPQQLSFSKTGRSASMGFGFSNNRYVPQHTYQQQQQVAGTPFARAQSVYQLGDHTRSDQGIMMSPGLPPTRSGEATDFGRWGLGLNTDNNPPPGILRRANRRASTTNLQLSHFIPEVDDEELANDDDSVTQFEAALLRLKTTGNPMTTRKNSHDQQDLNVDSNHEPSSEVPQQSANPEQPDAVGNNRIGTNIPALKFKDFRERMEKALPEHISIKVNEWTDLVSELTKTREQRELDEIASVHKVLLKWRLPQREDRSDDLDEEIPNKLGNQARKYSINSVNSSDGMGSKSHGIKEDFDDEPLTPRPSLSAERYVHQNQKSDVAHGGKGTGEMSSQDEDLGLDLLDDVPQYHDTETIRQLILEALDQRDFKRLNFIKTFFREGTVSYVLANSRAEMVWLSDWHTHSECTYAISIDREKRKVLLAFRGAYTESDWRHIVDWYDTATSNPVKDDYPGRPTNIRMHSGFHKSLFRVRKDTGTTKYDEIAAKLYHYCHMTGPNTRITITGHSLGAALACIFSLYASTEDRFTDNYGAIECVAFGSPCIANWRFAGAVKHQEDVGKLRVAKFHVLGDPVPHLPPALIRWSSRGAQYWHFGIDVSLPYLRKGKLFRTILGGQPKPKVTYWDPDEESYFGSLVRQIREYYVWNLPIRFWRFALFHTLVEHKKRMSLASKSDPNSLLAKHSLKELYDMRGDLTRRRFWGRRRKKNHDNKGE